MKHLWLFLKTAYRRKALLFHLLLTVAVCLIVSLVFIVSVFLNANKSILEDTVCEFERNILTEVHKTGENLTESMLSVPNLLYSNTDFVKLSQMERIDGYQNLNSLSLTAAQLLYANPYFQSIAIYLAKSGRMITTDFGIYEDASLYFDAEIMEFYHSEEGTIRIVESRSIPGDYQTLTTRTIFVKLYTNPSNLRQCTAVLAINSDYQTAFSNITKSSGMEKGKQIFVFDKEQLIFSSSALPKEVDFPTPELIGERSRQLTRINGRDFWLIPYVIDSRTYLSMAPADVIDQPAGKMALLTVLSSVLIFLLCFVMALFFSRKTIRPIERAVAALHTGESLPSPDGQTDDIAGMIRKLATHNKQLHEELYQSLPVMREDFLRGITQSAPAPNQNFDDMLALFQIKLPTDGLYLAMMDLETPFKASEIAGDMFLNQSVHMLLEEQLAGAGCRSASYSYDIRTIVLLVDLKENSPKFLFEIFDGVRLHIQSLLCMSVSFLLCEETQSLQNIHKSFSRCQAMRGYKNLYQKGSVIFCGKDPEPDEFHLDDYPVECENRLLKAVYNGDLAEAAVQLDLLLDTISRIHSILFLQNFIGNLIHRLSDLLLSAGKRPEKVLEIEKLEHIIAFDSYNDDIKKLLLEMISAVISSIGSASESRMERYYMEIVDYINAHYPEDLSLTDVSDHLFISKNYVNAVIQSRSEMTFVQMLTKTRIDAACALLKDKRYTIGEISERVGFRSPRYFIQVFKKQKGVTPGQYVS